MIWRLIKKFVGRGDRSSRAQASGNATSIQLGRAAYKEGRLEAALDHYRHWTENSPDQADSWLCLGTVFRDLQRLEEAAAAFRMASALEPAGVEPAFMLAMSFKALGKISHARDLLEKLAVDHPDFAPGWCELGLARELASETSSAAAAFQMAASADPKDAAAWLGLARMSLASGDTRAALAATEKCIRLHPVPPMALGIRADVLLQIGRSDEALQLVDRALLRLPGSAPLLHVRANALRKLGRLHDSVEAYRKVLEHVPYDTSASAGLAGSLAALNQFKEALDTLKRCAECNGSDPNAQNNLAILSMQMLQFDDARVVLRRALEVHPENRDLKFTLATLELTVGAMAEGWRLFEARPIEFASIAPRWRPGESIAGRRVLLLAEQGLGDAVQFARYVPEVLCRGAKSVALVLPERAKTLFEGVWENCKCLSESEVLNNENSLAVDVQCPLMSLPHVLGIAEPLEFNGPYVRSANERAEYWRLRIQADRPELLVGLVWSGSSLHPADNLRSMNLAFMRQVFEGSGHCFISLQYDVRESDCETLRDWNELIHVGNDQRDLSDTAALLGVLDVVVCVDTSVAHVAAALGRPVLLLLSNSADWRWRLNTDTTPWYPSVKLFRQGVDRSWQPVLERVLSELHSIAERKKAATF